jgi:hypothetical protein
MIIGQGNGLRSRGARLTFYLGLIGLVCITLLNPTASGHPGHAPPSAVRVAEPNIAQTLSRPRRAGRKVPDKWALWSAGTRLRGANIYQRRVYPELDHGFLGEGPLGPPFQQGDLDRLAHMGANYVNISHPGLYTETPPYVPDPIVQENLDRLLAMAAEADLYAVISFRTGPGRAEFSVCCLGDDWLEESYYNDTVWIDADAQQGWVSMWQYTAARYRDNPIVVGYDLMVEPNANEVLKGEWLGPEAFYKRYGGTLADWNQLHPRITAAIRQGDPFTPILVGGMGYSGVEWLAYIEPSGDELTVYTVHQYEPFVYTHQTEPLIRTYPGSFDGDWDGELERIDRAWLDDLLSPIDAFVAEHGAPVAVNEFGVMRWEPGAAAFMSDEMELFEARGLNYALWEWAGSFEPFVSQVDAFNFRHGPDPNNHTDVESTALMETIVSHWARNDVRPSSPLEPALHLPLIML